MAARVTLQQVSHIQAPSCWSAKQCQCRFFTAQTAHSIKAPLREEPPQVTHKLSSGSCRGNSCILSCSHECSQCMKMRRLVSILLTSSQLRMMSI
jgi:hypothetical protein